MAPSATDDGLTSQGEQAHYVDGALVPNTQKHGDNPVVIRLTDDERTSGTTKHETIQDLLKYLHRDGFVVLENAIEDHLVDRLYNRMVKDNKRLLTQSHMQYNQGEGPKNVSQIPPLTPDWLSRDFYANPAMIRVCENYLGPKPELRFLNSNVAIPGGTSRQAVHSDVYHSYPEIPFGLVMNIYLQDSDANNGVTELWTGTHNAYPQQEQQIHNDSGWIKKQCLQDRAKVKPPVQPMVRKGSICFRDLRLWHAGMPNTSDACRIMLAVDYFAEWYQCPMRLTLPRSVKDTVEREWSGVSTLGVDWVDGDLESTDIPFYLNMSQDPSMYLLQTPDGVQDWKARVTGEYNFDKAKVSSQNYWTAE